MRAIGITYTTGRITSTIYVSMRVGKKRKGSEEGRKGKERREREREREKEGRRAGAQVINLRKRSVMQYRFQCHGHKYHVPKQIIIIAFAIKLIVNRSLCGSRGVPHTESVLREN
jgi:hypothetical protein